MSSSLLYHLQRLVSIAGLHLQISGSKHCSAVNFIHNYVIKLDPHTEFFKLLFLIISNCNREV